MSGLPLISCTVGSRSCASLNSLSQVLISARNVAISIADLFEKACGTKGEMMCRVIERRVTKRTDTAIIDGYLFVSRPRVYHVPVNNYGPIFGFWPHCRLCAALVLVGPLPAQLSHPFLRPPLTALSRKLHLKACPGGRRTAPGCTTSKVDISTTRRRPVMTKSTMGRPTHHLFTNRTASRLFLRILCKIPRTTIHHNFSRRQSTLPTFRRSRWHLP